MDSLLTQGLVGLVFVLSVALWSKSSSSSGTPKEGSSLQKSKKKKKKSGNAVPSSSVAPPPTAPPKKPAVAKAEAQTQSLVSEKKESTPEEIKIASEQPKTVISNVGKKAAKGPVSKKKMTLEDFVAKTNEERVEELERAARGDAGDKDLGGDMIDRDLQPEVPYKKTARIEPIASRKSYPALSAEEGWESVGGKAKTVQPVTVGSKTNNVVSSNAWASSNPFALLPGSGAEPIRPIASASKPASSSATSSAAASAAAAAAQAQTKKQRQNAAKAQAKKAEKDAMEAERLARLAQHKKQVEAERMKDFFKKQPSSVAAPYSTHHQNGTNKAASTAGRSLPKASVNENGALVWD